MSISLAINDLALLTHQKDCTRDRPFSHEIIDDGVYGYKTPVGGKWVFYGRMSP